MAPFHMARGMIVSPRRRRSSACANDHPTPSLRRGNRAGLPPASDVETGRAVPRWKPGAQPPDGSGITLRSSARAASKASGAVDPWPIRRCVAAPRRKVASGVARRSTPCATSRATPSSSITWSSRSGSTPSVAARVASHASISSRSFVHRSSPCSRVARSLYHRRHAEAEEPDGLRGRHRGVPPSAPGPPGDRRGLVGDAPRAGAAAVEPRRRSSGPRRATRRATCSPTTSTSPTCCSPTSSDAR